MAVYQIKEYGRIRSIEDFAETNSANDEVLISGKSFDNIWDFILENQSKDKSIENAFALSKKNGKRVIQAKSYVGLIETKQKDTIEILPKVFNSKGEVLNHQECKRMFLKMLSTLKNTPFISIQQASLKTKEDFPILELFISLYVTEVEKLLITGLKKDYSSYESNSNYLKGSLLFSKHLLRNIANESKFYIRYTKYQEDIPQNRIIMSTLKKLFNATSKNANREAIMKLMGVLSEIKVSENIIQDLDRCKNNVRSFSDYEMLLRWSEVFLLNKSFTNFSGNNVNQALLFPMSTIFESFISHLFKKHSQSHIINTQHFQYYLVSRHIEEGKFKIKPDLFAEPKKDTENHVVIDTKWKIVDENLPNKNYLISQADMYQLYAYGRKYTKGLAEPKLFLIYPKTNQFTKELESFYYEETEGKYHLELKAFPFDLLEDYEEQIESILKSINSEFQVNSN